MDPTDYTDRENAYVKHYVLKHYLEQLAYKVGQFRPGTTLNYVDGFSGPWQAARQDQGDTSPAVALTTLRHVRDDLGKRGIALNPRGMFVEKDTSAFERLQELLTRFEDMETRPFLGKFEERIADGVRFATHGMNPFAFTFIDPTGWTGMALRLIEPLLRVSPGEVLINFMLKDILRFIDSPDASTRPSFDALFGQESESYLSRWTGLRGLDREDAIVAAYIGSVRRVGAFEYSGSTIILNPQEDRTHYHLVYATRSRQGMVAFRNVEKAAYTAQMTVRAGAKARRRVASTRQETLFGADEMDSPYSEQVRERYQTQAHQTLRAVLVPGKTIEYEVLLDVALRFPLTSESQLKQWLREMQAEGLIQYLGFDPKETTPKLDKGHCVRAR